MRDLPTAIQAEFTALQTALELHARTVILKGGARDFGAEWDQAMGALGRLRGQVINHISDLDVVHQAAVKTVRRIHGELCPTEPTPPFEVGECLEADEIAIDPLEAEMARRWDAEHAAIMADFRGGSNA